MELSWSGGRSGEPFLGDMGTETRMSRRDSPAKTKGKRIPGTGSREGWGRGEEAKKKKYHQLK